MLQDSYNHLPITLLRLRNNAMKFYSRLGIPAALRIQISE